MNILKNREKPSINLTSRIQDLYDKFEGYQEKRGNIEEAFSLLLGYILEKKQLGLYLLEETEKCSIFLHKLKLVWDEMFATITFHLAYDLGDVEYRNNLKSLLIKTIKSEKTLRLNVEEIWNYIKEIEDTIQLVNKIDRNNYDIQTIDGEIHIMKYILDWDMQDEEHRRYIENLIFRLEDNEEIKQNIRRIYKNKNGDYILVWTNWEEIIILSKLNQLSIWWTLEDAEFVMKYESIIQENISEKYKELFENSSNSYDKMTTKQKLFKVISFWFYKPNNSVNKEKIVEIKDWNLEEIHIREISEFYKKNMFNSTMSLLGISANNLKYLELSAKVLEDIKNQIEDFLKNDRAIWRISRMQDLIEIWQEIKDNENIVIMTEYIIKNKILEWKELRLFLENIEEEYHLDLPSIAIDKIYLDEIVQTQENRPYNMLITEENIYVHSPNKWILIIDRKTREENLIMISWIVSSFSPNGQNILLVEETNKSETPYIIYDLKNKETKKEFQLVNNNYAWHQNILTNKYFAQISTSELYISYLDYYDFFKNNLDIEMFSISGDKENKYIFIKSQKEIQYIDTDNAEISTLHKLSDEDLVVDMISTAKWLNLLVMDLETQEIRIIFYEISDWIISTSYNTRKFQWDYQPIQNIVKISPENKQLLLIRKKESSSDILIFDIQYSSIVPVATISDIQGDIDSISFWGEEEISYVVNNHIHIVNINALKILEWRYEKLWVKKMMDRKKEREKKSASKILKWKEKKIWVNKMMKRKKDFLEEKRNILNYRLLETDGTGNIIRDNRFNLSNNRKS